MTSINQARAAIYSRFIDLWEDETIYTFDNEIFTPPEDESWVRLTVRHTTSSQNTLGPDGGRKFMRSGVIFIQIFVDKDTGIKDADDLAILARNIFEGTSFTGVNVRDTNIQEIGIDEKWYTVEVTANFDYYETK